MTLEMLDATEAEMLECHRRNVTLPFLRAERAGIKSAPRKKASRVVEIPPVLPGQAFSQISLSFPFHILAPDNGRARLTVIKGRIFSSKRYRKAKKLIRKSAEIQYIRSVITTPIRLVATVWFPSTRGDVTNLIKLCHDSLQGIIYADDKQIEDARWIRAGVDKYQARVEITINPLVTYGDD